MSQTTQPSISPPPDPLVKKPRLISSGGSVLGSEWRVGRGYSIGEVRAVGLTVSEARLLGIRVDPNRDTIWDINVQRLREWLSKVIRGEVLPPEPALHKTIKIKRKKGRVFRALTPAGRKMRGLMSVGLRETHVHKWRKKARERIEKRRHEVVRTKGGH
ncbi:50S ribosomal protein L13E [Vulcanisaeta moutnovskia 768-28]|uniref:Large ribosomal subunit protein eL13 n=1 Tax=Vulcanisaeta moutnovskia (strain 768-28) TaxID=985053 RepID=F0QUW7_VULM7|nr:ribosomal protein L13e [Vulcanisaeta moutnovskia]ADY01949.1 50S ribosomal protein L13E [Vulcanisaeta moutnovskia 768-28]